MFERFTERARRVLFFARYEASQLGSASIDTEHLLLGLIREGKGLTTVSSRMPASPSTRFATKYSAVFPRGRRPHISRRSRSAPPPSACSQHAAEEADRLSHDYIGTEHLLLGLLREQGSVAADVLTSRGLRLDRCASRIVEFLSDGERPGHPGPPGVPANTFKWPWLRFVPSRTVHILYSELKPPQQPVTNDSGPGIAGLWLHADRSHRPRLARQPLAHRHRRRS